MEVSMEKQVYIECSEQEIVELIQEHICKKYDSIVAAEEIGNQDWTTCVEMPEDYDKEEVERLIKGERGVQWQTRSIMCYLHLLGHLEAGEYIVDCTW
jgi:hypothetical protein